MGSHGKPRVALGSHVEAPRELAGGHGATGRQMRPWGARAGHGRAGQGMAAGQGRAGCSFDGLRVDGARVDNFAWELVASCYGWRFQE